MKLKHLTILLLLLISSCQTLKDLKPTDMVWKITNGKPCYYNTIKDLQSGKNITCKEFKDFEGWLLIYPEKLKEVLTKGIDELIVIKAKN